MILPIKKFSKPKLVSNPSEKLYSNNDPLDTNLTDKVETENNYQQNNNTFYKYLPIKLQPILTKILQPTVQSILIVTLLLFLARGLGFIRQILIYQKMDPIASDLLLSASKIPETITTFLIMGTIVSSVLPIASRIETKYKEDSQEKLSLYLNLILATLLTIMFGFSTILFIFTPQVLQVVTSADILNKYNEANIFEDYVLVSRIFLLGPILFASQAVLGLFLTMKKRFLVYASAGVFYNIGAVVALIFSSNNNYIAVAWGMTLGTAFAVLVYWLTALKAGYKGSYLVSPSKLLQGFRLHYTDFWQTWKLFLPRIFLIHSAVFANLIIIYIAQDQGQITALDIALSIQSVFLVLIGAIGSVFFPDLAKIWNSAQQDSRPFWNKLFSYTEKTALITLVGTIITFFAIPLVMWIFEISGKGQDNGDYIIYLARITTLSLVFQAVNEILIKYFYVRERVWQPVLVSIAGTIAQIIVTFSILNIVKDAGVITTLGLGLGNLTVMLISFWLIRTDYKKDLKTSQQNNNNSDDSHTKESDIKMLPFNL